MELVPSPLSPPPKPKLTTVLSESLRLIKSEPRRFLALFFAFLVPLGVSRITIFNAVDGDKQPVPVWLTGTLLVNLVLKTLSLIAAVSITSVAFPSLNGEPVVKSVSASFFRLLATDLIQYAILFAVVFGFFMLIFCAVLFSVLLGFRIDPDSRYVRGLTVAVVAVPSVLVSVHLTVSWALVTPVVVAESKWGLEALKRSESLVKGKRCLASVLYLIFAVLCAVFGWEINYEYSVADERVVVGVALLVVAQVVVVSSLRTIFKLYETVATTLLYVFCKAVQEEEFSGDNQYVRLGVDDCEKVASGLSQV